MKIPIHNKLRISRRLLSGIRGPLSASLFITRKCNLNCPYCKAIRHTWKDLKTDQWFKVIDKLYQWGGRLYSITGGEPMLRKDITDIISYISNSRKAIPWLISNFTIMTKDKIKQLADAGLLFLTASLDSLSDIGFKSDRSVLELLEYAKSQGIICSTITVIHQNNINEIPDIMHEVTSRGIIFDIGFYQNVGGLFSTSDSGLKVQDITKLKKIRSILQKHKLKTGLVAPSWKFLKSDLQMYTEMSWKCPSQKDTFLVINNDGRLMPCQEYVSDVNILDIKNLNNPQWRLEKEKIVAQCAGCYYGCYFQKVHINLFDTLLDTYTMLRV